MKIDAALTGTVRLEPMPLLSADSSARMADAAPKNSGVHLWLVLMKAHRALARHAMRSIEPSGLGFSDFAVLEVLLHKGPQRVNDIGRLVDLTSGSITTAIDRLQARSLVARGSDEADRRTRIVRLTPTGRARIREAFAEHAAALEIASSGLTKSERKSLVELLKKLGISAEQQA
jgi:MarR family transcriptional regulator, 2-MHQ and catechol-resistance regulon repressor